LKKKGIALLITISLVAVIASLIGISAGILDHSFKRISNKKFLIQSNSFISGLTDVLKDASSDVNDSDSLDIFLSFPFVFEQKSRDLSVDIYFTSEATGLNPNDMLEENNATRGRDKVKENENIKPSFEASFDHILTVYNVSDKILLLSMIADSVDSDLKERTTGSELALENSFFSQGRIYSIEHFNQIIDAYKHLTLDYSVDAIPWETLLSFNNKDIDFNHIESDALKAMFPELDEATLTSLTSDRVEVYKDFSLLNIDSQRKKELEKLGLTFYSPQVKAWMNIRNGDNHLGVTFLYDLKNKKATNFEIIN
jgi:hypothetical protein